MKTDKIKQIVDKYSELCLESGKASDLRMYIKDAINEALTSEPEQGEEIKGLIDKYTSWSKHSSKYTAKDVLSQIIADLNNSTKPTPLESKDEVKAYILMCEEYENTHNIQDRAGIFQALHFAWDKAMEQYASQKDRDNLYTPLESNLSAGECQFESDNSTSATICKHCGREKYEHENISFEKYPINMGSIGDEKEWDMNEQYRNCWLEGYQYALQTQPVSNPDELESKAVEITDKDIENEGINRTWVGLQIEKQEGFIEGAKWMRELIKKQSKPHPKEGNDAEEFDYTVELLEAEIDSLKEAYKREESSLKHEYSNRIVCHKNALKALEQFANQPKGDCKRCKQLEFMINNGLGQKDMENDIHLPNEI